MSRFLLTSFLLISALVEGETGVFLTAKVERVVDGDTLIMQVQRYGIWQKERVRLIGIDTPEIQHEWRSGEPLGEVVKEYVMEELRGKDVFLELDLDERDPYDRLLAYVWMNNSEEIGLQQIRDKMLNSLLLQKGYAQVMMRRPNGKYQDYFTTYQREAQTARLGIWEDRQQ